MKSPDKDDAASSAARSWSILPWTMMVWGGGPILLAFSDWASRRPFNPWLCLLVLFCTLGLLGSALIDWKRGDGRAPDEMGGSPALWDREIDPHSPRLL
jgi:hypothetical protein